MKTENTVFISYRRTNAFIARAVYQDLRTNGFDVFLDYQSIDSGSFERIILNQIGARAHFVIILTPSALERCVNPNDWLRREIERAIELKRNIVPLMFENFEFEKAEPYLIDKLSALPQYNAVRVPKDYFEEAMSRLRTRFLNHPLDIVLHPVSPEDAAAIQSRKAQVDAQDGPTEAELGAESQYEAGLAEYRAKHYEAALEAFDSALKSYPAFAAACSGRGLVHHAMGDYDAAIQDFSAAMGQEPRNYSHWFNRGSAYHVQKRLSEATADYTETLRLNPAHVEAYTERAFIRLYEGDIEAAIEDFENAKRIDPDYGRVREGLAVAKARQSRKRNPLLRLKNAMVSAEAPQTAIEYYELAVMRHVDDRANKIEDLTQAIALDEKYYDAYLRRGGIYYHQGKFEEAMADDNAYIELRPKDTYGYNNRAECYFALGQYDKAQADFEKALELNEMNVYATAGLAITYHKQGHPEKVGPLLKKLAQLDKRVKDADWLQDYLNWHDILADTWREMFNKQAEPESAPQPDTSAEG